uniref:(northern house mosquito) hypothetical protein n=1 Tax=Culex pipiens TaxID=7175 RepID=A0A8D8NBP3_CULPI
MHRRLIQQHVTPIRKSSARMMRECICFVQSSPARNYERDLATAVVQDLEHLTTMISAAEGQLLEENYPSLVSLAGALQELSHFLVNLAPTSGRYEDDEASRSDVYRRIYVLVKMLSDKDEGVKERQALFWHVGHQLQRHVQQARHRSGHPDEFEEGSPGRDATF